MKSFFNLFLVLFVLPFASCFNETCVVYKATTRGYAGFTFQQKKTTNLSDTSYVKRVRDSNVYLQIVGYENGQYGHYVTYTDNNETRLHVNGTLEQVVYQGVSCVSSSFQPKELNKTWVKNFTGSSPFENEGNTTSKSFVGSVTLKCYEPSCYTYSPLNGSYDLCSYGLEQPTNVSLRVNFTVAPQNIEYSYNTMCFSDYGYKNGTHSCNEPYVSGYSYSYSYLNATLDGIVSRTQPNKVKTILHPRHLKHAYSFLTHDAQLYSVCSGSCTALNVDM
jgi:hypothetical protein